MKLIDKAKRLFLQWQLEKVNEDYYLSGNEDNKNYNIYINQFNEFDESDKKFVLTISTARAIILQDIYFDKIDEIIEVVKGISFKLEEELI
ncbi:MAG: hypothetical protein KGZ96_13235 [Clostridia bacterium]|nr:hypothetical protein [Clostridia bacterium]